MSAKKKQRTALDDLREQLELNDRKYYREKDLKDSIKGMRVSDPKETMFEKIEPKPNRLKYIGKRFINETMGGITGITNALSTETANNLEKGKKKSTANNLLDLFSTVSRLNPNNFSINAVQKMADATKNNILKCFHLNRFT